jgi:hypothetical protein
MTARQLAMGFLALALLLVGAVGAVLWKPISERWSLRNAGAPTSTTNSGQAPLHAAAHPTVSASSFGESGSTEVAPEAVSPTPAAISNVPRTLPALSSNPTAFPAVIAPAVATPATLPSTRPTHAAKKLYFDATVHVGKPDLTGTGLTPIYMIYEASFFPPKDSAHLHPNEAICRNQARLAANYGGITCLDIESWPADPRIAAPPKVEESLRKLAQIADWMHDEKPGLRLGFYGIMPICDFWTSAQYRKAQAMKGKHPWWDAYYDEFERQYKLWLACNDFVRERLASHADVVFPSLYQFYPEIEGWEIYARDNLSEADRFNKASFPFLWFRYHPEGKNTDPGFLPEASWRRQLEVASELADGAVIWGGYRERWNAEAPWWKATEQFLQRQPRRR